MYWCQWLIYVMRCRTSWFFIIHYELNLISTRVWFIRQKLPSLFIHFCSVSMVVRASGLGNIHRWVFTYSINGGWPEFCQIFYLALVNRANAIYANQYRQGKAWQCYVCHFWIYTLLPPSMKEGNSSMVHSEQYIDKMTHVFLVYPLKRWLEHQSEWFEVVHYNKILH